MKGIVVPPLQPPLEPSAPTNDPTPAPEEPIAPIAPPVRVAAILKSRLFFASSVPAPVKLPTLGTTARKFSARKPFGAMWTLVVSFSISRSFPVFNPVRAETADILEPRSNPASLAEYSPIVPSVTSLFVGPFTLRLVFSVPAVSEAPLGRFTPIAGRNASRSLADIPSPFNFKSTVVVSPCEAYVPFRCAVAPPILIVEGVSKPEFLRRSYFVPYSTFKGTAGRGPPGTNSAFENLIVP